MITMQKLAELRKLAVSLVDSARASGHQPTIILACNISNELITIEDLSFEPLPVPLEELLGPF